MQKNGSKGNKNKDLSKRSAEEIVNTKPKNNLAFIKGKISELITAIDNDIKSQDKQNSNTAINVEFQAF